MISLEEFENGKKELEDKAAESPAFNDEEYDFTYGFQPQAPHQLGWMMITTDYPNYIIFFLGESLEAALTKLANDFVMDEEDEE